MTSGRIHLFKSVVAAVPRQGSVMFIFLSVNNRLQIRYLHPVMNPVFDLVCQSRSSLRASSFGGWRLEGERELACNDHCAIGLCTLNFSMQNADWSIFKLTPRSSVLARTCCDVQGKTN